MHIYITDSLNLSRLHKEFTFHSNEFNQWILKDSKHGVLYEKIEKRKRKIRSSKFEVTQVSAIVSSSNYRLIFDLIQSYDNISFYEPTDINNPFLFPYTPDKKSIFKLFDNYIKRGYISSKVFLELGQLGLHRIEQFYSILLFIKFKNFSYFFDNFQLDSDELITISNIENIGKETYSVSNKVNLIKFIKTISIVEDYDFFDVFHELLSLYYIGGCSDPFHEDGLTIYSDDGFFYDFFQKISNSKIEVSTRELSFKNSSKKNIVRTSLDNILSIYHELQKVKYFNGMIISPSALSLSDIYSRLLIYMTKFIPLKDSLLTVQLLSNLNKFQSIKNNQLLLENQEWISDNTWIEINNSLDYYFNIDEIIVPDLDFICPICGNKETRVSPLSLQCRNNDCTFKFLRTNLNVLGVSRISIEDICLGLKFGSALIRTKNGKYKRFLVNNERENIYTFWIE